jgi:DNA-3-methyladenine glycosylase
MKYLNVHASVYGVGDRHPKTRAHDNGHNALIVGDARWIPESACHDGRMSGRLTRDFFAREVSVVARDLLGRDVVSMVGAMPVTVRLTEVEAYAGLDDPASHAFRGRTPRTAVMFGPPGHLYTYFVYGMHWCANIVTGADGVPSAVLLRAGAVVDGLEYARGRRPRVTDDRQLARGPAGLATVLGCDASTNGADLCGAIGALGLNSGSPPADADIRVGPRVGVAAAADVERRFWVDGDRTVSAFRAWVPRKRSSAGPGAKR